MTDDEARATESEGSTSNVTPRLQLQPLEARHAPALYEVLRDPDLYAYISESPPGSVDELRRRYHVLEGRSSPDGAEVWLNWAIRRLADSRYLGYVQATLRGESAEIAYVLRSDAWGQGYAREAVEWMLAVLASQWHIRHVLAHIDRDNRRSIVLARRLGFTSTTEINDTDIEFRKDIH